MFDIKSQCFFCGEKKSDSKSFWCSKKCFRKTESRVWYHNTRVAKKGNTELISSEDWVRKVKNFGFKCAHCEKLFDPPKESLTIDHVKSLGRGGLNVESNLMPLCRECHDVKTDMFDLPEKRK